MKLENWQNLKKDLRHWLVSFSLTSFLLVFYLKLGFYGWPHLISVLMIEYAIFPIDDWLDRERPFPYHILPLLAFSFYHFPLITVLALLGILITNLRALFKQDNFGLERLEALGNLFIYVTPMTLPIAKLNTPQLYLAACLFLLFADCFHKLGHQESKNNRLTWLSGLGFIALEAIIFARPHWLCYVSAGILLPSLIPFKILKTRFQLWFYTQLWIGFAGIVAFNYYLSLWV